MLSIIIPQYNMPKMTENCIDSILSNTSCDYEIVLVDNGSASPVSDLYKKKVVYVRNDTNLMFSGGCNLGASRANGNFLCFLNNDTLVKPGWHDCMKLLEENYEVGLVGPKLLYPDKTIQHAGIQCVGNDINRPIFDHRYRGLPENFRAANSIREYQCITGACIFVRRDDFLSIDGFSTSYKNGYEDADLCFKIRVVLKKRVMYFPRSSVYHLENKTPRDSSMMFNEENHATFFKTWGESLFVDSMIFDEMDRSEKKTNKPIESYWRLLP